MSEESRANLIRAIVGREILDSRGLPTVEVDVELVSGHVGRASVPTGASMGAREALELRDGDAARYAGQGVRAALHSVTHVIAPLLAFKDVCAQKEIDEALAVLDGTERKGVLGANAILAVSLAVARAAALARGKPLYRALASSEAFLLPLPQFNLINGGAHADNGVDLEELMIIPMSARTFHDALRIGAETYLALKAILKRSGLSTAVGDEGGFAPRLSSNEHGIEMLLAAIVDAGLTPGKDAVIALDVAASRLFDGGRYTFTLADKRRRSAADLVSMYERWVAQYPIASIEDGVAETDADGWRLLTERLGGRVQLVGDDVFVTHERYVRDGVRSGIANAVLIKLNQVGTLTEAIATMRVAREAGYATIVSHRSGETPDDFIADFAVATHAGQIKAGAPSRERIAKYNQLVRIEEQLGPRARLAAGLAPARNCEVETA